MPPAYLEKLNPEQRRAVEHGLAWRRMKLQIPPSPLRAHFVKARVKVRQYHDGSHAVFHGPRCLGRYDTQGALQMAALGAAA